MRAQLRLWRARLAFRRARWHSWQRRAARTRSKRAERFEEKWKRLVDQAHAKTEAIEKQLKTKAHKPPPTPQPITMYDSTEVGEIPKNAEAVAGYVGGKWPTYNELTHRFPHAHWLSIAINAQEDADCLDVEQGDASPSQVVTWVKRQWARGVKRPCIYASLSVMPEIQTKLNAAGIHRDQYRLWVAHYTYKQHIEPGYDATQWTDKAFSKNLDQSLCVPTFFS